MLQRSANRGASRGGGGAFSSFQAPGYSTLWWAGLFSFMAVQMQFLLRGILAWDLTEREGALGLTYLCFGVTLLIATPLGGVASDRLSKRMVLIASQAVIVSAATAMGIVVVTGNVRFWMLLVAAVAQGSAFGFFGPARVAISAEIVGREQLGNAITLSLLSMNGTRVFAPSLAGVLAGISSVGIGGTYLISAACSAISFIYLLRLPALRPQVASEPAAVAGPTGGPGPSTQRERDAAPVAGRSNGAVPGRRQVNPLAEIAVGVRYVAARKPLRRLIVSSFFVIMFGFNYVAFYPALVKGEFGLGDGWVGLISSASAVGAVLVSFPLAARADSPWAKTAMIFGGLGFGGGVIAVGLAGSFWVAFGVICVVGAATTIYQSLSSTLAMGMTDDTHQGRVQSLMQLSFAGFGIAALPLGGLAEVIGLRPTIMLMGGVATIAVVAYLVLEGGIASVRPARSPASSDRVEGGSVADDVDLAGTPAAGA